MTKKQAPSKQSRKKAANNTGQLALPSDMTADEFWKVTGELVQMGLIVIDDGNGDGDGVFVPMPEQIATEPLDRVSADTRDADLNHLLSSRSMPPGLLKQLNAFSYARWAYIQATTFPKMAKSFGVPSHELAALVEKHGINKAGSEAVLFAMLRGIDLAITYFAEYLTGSKEATQFLRARRQAGQKGRTTQQQRKSQRAAKVQEMLGKGSDIEDIAKELGCSIATVYRLANTTIEAGTTKPQARRRK